ncbi:MAG: hypothetical protein ABI811_13095 [Acidobacteriota bacterium]
MKTTLLVLTLAACPLAFGQITDYLGPGVTTGGAGNIGRRSGQDVDLRYFVNATGVYDTGLVPFNVDSKGALLKPKSVFGVELGIGAYGRHTWRRSVLGLDYGGNYRHYPAAQSYNGANQQLALGYTFQKSQRLVFDFQESAGTYNYGAVTANGGGVADGSIIDPTSLLFDNRTMYVQSNLDVRIAKSSRTVITIGGSGYIVRRQAKALVGVNGYNLHGNVQHRVSASTVLGVAFQHIHYDYPKAFGESDINMYTGNVSRVFSRVWTLNLSAGFYRSEVQGIQDVAVDPALTALLGISRVRSTYFRVNFIPTGSATVSRSFRKSSLNFSYTRSVSPGNGVYLTSRQEAQYASWAYTGLRKVSFSLTGSRSVLDALGQDLSRYTQIAASATLSYALTNSLHLSGTLAHRKQDIENNTFRPDSNRVSFSIVFSPGDVPISFH